MIFDDWDSFVSFLRLISYIIIMFLIIIGLISGITAVNGYFEVKAFNKVHGTNYTWGEWFWGEGVIKDYYLGKVENLNVDLNVRGLKGGID